MRLKSFVILFAMIMLAAPSIMAQIIAKGVIQDVGKRANGRSCGQREGHQQWCFDRY